MVPYSFEVSVQAWKTRFLCVEWSIQRHVIFDSKLGKKSMLTYNVRNKRLQKEKTTS